MYFRDLEAGKCCLTCNRTAAEFIVLSSEKPYVKSRPKALIDKTMLSYRSIRINFAFFAGRYAYLGSFVLI